MLLRQLGWCAAELLSTPRQQRPEEGGRTGWLVFDADGLRSMSLDETTSFSDPPASPTTGGWERQLLHDFGAPVWRLSWSVSGNILSVSDANNAVTLWKEAADGQWQQLTQ